MKYFLLLLAVKLVISDKLDRTYLPPPGAKFSGGSIHDLQTPLEYPKETYLQLPEYNQFSEPPIQDSTRIPNNQDLRSKVSKILPNDAYSTFKDTSEEYDYSLQTLKPDIGIYQNLPLVPNGAYLFGEKIIGAQPLDIALTSKLAFESASTMEAFMQPQNEVKASGYYYYVPVAQTIKSIEESQGYNQINNGYPGQSNITTQKATTQNIPQNYQPSAFGMYGGNPMIMTSQISLPQDFENMMLSSKFGDYENDIPTTSVDEDKESTEATTVAHPFQTPLVGTNATSAHITNTNTSKYLSSSSNRLQLPTTTEGSIIKNNGPIVLEQRLNVPAKTKIRYTRPQAESDRNAVIINYDNIITPEGYSYAFDTSNGIHADERGITSDGTKSTGFYSYIGDDGKTYSITYTADENGFQPRGDHLPTPPPIPEAIKKVIEQATRIKASGVINDGSYDEEKYGHKNYQTETEHYRPFTQVDTIDVAQRSNSNPTIPTDAQRKLTANEKIVNNDNQSFGDQYQVMRTIFTNPIQAKSLNESPTQPLQVNTNKVNDQTVNTTNDKEQQLYNEKVQQLNVTNTELENKHLIELEGKVKSTLANNKVYENSNTQTADRSSQSVKIPLGPDYKMSTKQYFYDQEQHYQQAQPNLHSNKVMPSKYKTSYDNGYYYVPPIIKFEEKPSNKHSEQLASKNIANKMTNTQSDTNANISRRIGIVDNNKKMPEMVTNRKTTRKPYISGPKYQIRGFSEDTQNHLFNPNEYEKKLTTYTNDLDSSSYIFTTTPMPSQAMQFRNEPTMRYNNQYFQTTSVPEAYEKILPNTVQNRGYVSHIKPEISVSQNVVTYRPDGYDKTLPNIVQNEGKLFYRRPEISVSQNVVTSTYRPGTSVSEGYDKTLPDIEQDGGNVSYRRPEISVTQNVVTSTYRPGTDGINVKVNQNVNFYDHRSDNENDIIKGDKAFTSNEKLSQIVSPEQKTSFTEYPDTSFEGLKNDQATNYDNEYFISNASLIENGFTFSDTPVKSDVRSPFQFDTTIFPENVSYKDLDNSVPAQDSPISYTDDQIPAQKVVGEDFSGPKQTQGFDPETGYYYK